MNDIAKNTLEERLQGDTLLDAQDTIEEIKAANGEVDEHGNVILYHRTTTEAKQLIENTGTMIAKENGLFFSTKEKGQNEGYGEAIVKLAIPVEKLVMDDCFADEIHFCYPLNRTRIADVSNYLIKE